MDALLIDPLLAELNKSLFTGCWFVSAVATADAIISVSCAGVVGMFRVGSVTVLAITLNVVGADVVRLVLTKNFLKPVPDQWITVKAEESPQRILNYAQDKRCSNEIWVEST